MQIRTLLLVIGSGVMLAVLLALLSLQFYSPTGSYTAKNVLLAPESLASMRFADGTTREGGTPRYVFAAIEFSFYDGSLKKWSTRPVSLDQYASFYSLVENEKSIAEATKAVEDAFRSPYLTSLVIKVRQDGASARQPSASAVIEVDFADEGDYYRIQLRGGAGARDWAYFQRPGIHNAVLKLFGPAI